ncbi:MAG: TonB-dependent receptor [Proteobacteria bacterium]|nr:TonB-dependent receptor [Pseudomonadota bacterium]
MKTGVRSQKLEVGGWELGVRNRKLAAQVALLAGFAGAVSAQEGKTNAPTVLAPVVVTATRTEEPVDKTAASVSVITRTAIDEQKFTTLADALASVPGLVVTRNGTPGQATSVFLRGTESNHTLLTVDGRRAPSMLAGGYDWGNIGLDNVERIEVVRSSSSSLYGGDAIGGVVNVITRTGRGLAKPEYETSFEGGSFNSFREALATRGAVGGFDYAVAGSQFDAAYPRDNNLYRNSNVRSSFGYEVGEQLYFDVKASYLQTDGGSPGALPGTAFDHLKRETVNVSPGMTLKVSDQWETRLYYTFENQFQPSSDFGDLNRLSVASHMVDWQNNVKLTDQWKLTAGVLWQDQHVERTTTSIFGGGINNGLQDLGGYVQSQWSPLERLTVINSVRFDAYSDYQSATTWRQGLSYRLPTTETLLFGNVARSVAPPTAQDLYFFGNPNLKPERALSWELGVEQPLWQDRLALSTTWFQHQYHDFIQLDGFGVPQNVSEATSEGVEIGVKFKPCDKFTANASYTYLTTTDDTQGIRLLRRPRHLITLDSVWKPVEKLTLSAGANWVVERQDVTFPPPTFTATNVPIEDYLLLRAAAAYQFNPHVQVWVRGDNLLDQKYEILKGYPALRLGAYAGVKVTF